jgi:hypothetical protein
MHLGSYDAPMPTPNPRITITLTPSSHAVMKSLSDLSGNSMSSMVAEIITMNEPVFARMVKVLQAAKTVQASSKESMMAALNDAQTKIEQQLGLALDAMDDGFRPVLDDAEEVRRRGRKGSPPAGKAAAREGVPTPISNRGVRSVRTTSKVIASSVGEKRGLPAKVAAKRRGVKK